MACKWVFGQKINLAKNSNLQKIVQFFVWETPVPDISAKGVTFAEMGIRGAKYKTLQADLRKMSGFPSANGHDWIRTTATAIEGELDSIGMLQSYECGSEFAIHTVKAGLGKTEALFYLIRNSLAHGSFRISKHNNEAYYVFESRQGAQLKGRAIIKESTLLGWISLLAAKRNRGKQYDPK